MAQGDFTKAEATMMAKAFEEVFKALPKKKQLDFLGHANDIYLFLATCKEKCPDEVK